jgi:hypothetical protein
MPNPAIPALVKHMTIAIYRKGKISAKNKKDRFEQCLKIAKSRCAQYGLTDSPGTSLSEAIGLTPAGRIAEMRHKTEGRQKTVLFDTLYDDFDIDGTKAAKEKTFRERLTEIILGKRDENKAKASKKDRF